MRRTKATDTDKNIQSKSVGAGHLKDIKRKVNKNEFLSAVSKRSGFNMTVIRAVYAALIEEIKNVVCHGYDLSLTGFGSFLLKKHKGHPVQFEAKTDTVKDYIVLKFAASDVLMTDIRKNYKQDDTVSENEI